MVRLFIIGLTILAIAIFANGIVIKIGLKSWYDFITLLNQEGSSSFNTLNFIDWLWLFIAYPLILGSSYLLGDKLYNWLISLV